MRKFSVKSLFIMGVGGGKTHKVQAKSNVMQVDCSSVWAKSMEMTSILYNSVPEEINKSDTFPGTLKT